MKSCAEMFAERIKELREEKNMSLRELAEATGISKTALSYYENCERDPSLTVVKTISDFFDEDINYMVGDSQERRKKNNKGSL